MYDIDQLCAEDNNFSGPLDYYDTTRQANHTVEIGASRYWIQEKDKYFTSEHDAEKSEVSEPDQAPTVNLEGLFRRKERPPGKNIKVSAAYQDRYMITMKGIKSQTAQLNINVRTLTKNFLSNSVKTRHFNKEQIDKIRTYSKANANFLTTQELFGVKRLHKESSEGEQSIVVGSTSDRIRVKCLEEFSSSRVIRNILKSQKMAFKNKIVMIKYLENIRQGAAFPEYHNKWKGK